MPELTVGVWNLHWGTSGRPVARRRPRFDVLEGLEHVGLLRADVLVLAETFRGHDGHGIVDGLADLGYRLEESRFGAVDLEPRPHATRGPGVGSSLLTVATRLPVSTRHDLRLPPVLGDPAVVRHAVSLTLPVDGAVVRLVGLHASSKLWFGGPWRHLAGLARQLPRDRPLVVAGDCNLWGPLVERILPGLRRAVRGRTYPAHRPHSQIDHVLVDDRVEVVDAAVLSAHRSDHRAVLARLRVGRDDAGHDAGRGDAAG